MAFAFSSRKRDHKYLTTERGNASVTLEQKGHPARGLPKKRSWVPVRRYPEGKVITFRSRKQWHRHCHPTPSPKKAKVVFLGFPDRLPGTAGESDFTKGRGLAKKGSCAAQQSFLRQVRGLPCLCFQRRASRCWDQGAMGRRELAEVCIESSANDQPPHFTGPSSDLVQFGIS